LLLIYSPTTISTFFPYTTLFRSKISRNFCYIGKDIYKIRSSFRESSAAVIGADKDKESINETIKSCMFRSRTNMSHLLKKTLLRSEEHTSELQSRFDLVCRLLLE